MKNNHLKYGLKTKYSLDIKTFVFFSKKPPNNIFKLGNFAMLLYLITSKPINTFIQHYFCMFDRTICMKHFIFTLRQIKKNWQILFSSWFGLYLCLIKLHRIDWKGVIKYFYTYFVLRIPKYDFIYLSTKLAKTKF